MGTSEYSFTSDGVSNRSFISGVINLSSSKVFELLHRCSLTKATDGLGVGSSFGDVNVFAQIKITKLQ